MQVGTEKAKSKNGATKPGKKAAPPRPSELAAAKKDAAKTNADADEDGDDGKVPPHYRKAAAMLKESRRIRQRVNGKGGKGGMSRWKANDTVEEVKAKLMESARLLEEGAKLLQSLGEGFDPFGRGAATRNLRKGMTVSIREKRRNKYADLLPEEELEGIKVQDVGKSKVVGKTPGGMTLFFDRGDLEIQA